MNARGWYEIKDSQGNVISSDNVITSLGEGLIMLFMSGEAVTWAGKFAIGGGETAAAAGDTKLEYPYNHIDTESYTADTTAKTVTAKTTITGNIAGEVYEVGVYNLAANPNETNSFLKLTDFNFDNVESDGSITVDTTNHRMGPSGAKVNADSDGTTAQLLNLVLDASAYDSTDEFTFGYYTYDANGADIEIRIMNNTNDYYTYNFAPATAVGFNIVDIAKSSFSAVGSATWSGITQINAIVKATGATTTDITLDGLTVRDIDAYTDYGLVSHSILDTPVTVVAGQSYEMTYTVEFTQ